MAAQTIDKFTARKQMPDVSKNAPSDLEISLDQVGMSEVEMPLALIMSDNKEITVPSKVLICVSLDDKKAKGIHMSRLYLLLQEHLTNGNPLTMTSIEELLKSSILSQKNLSQQSFIEIKFDLPIQRKALLSQSKGWREYPVNLKFKMNSKKEVSCELGMIVTYSSTCPCSAALARQLVQEKFESDFSNDSTRKVNFDSVKEWLGKAESIMASPHSQRSFAHIKLKMQCQLDIIQDVRFVIDLIEDTLKTPVQTAVKREDEQEFARLNGTHPMFCEDAARKIKHQFENNSKISDYYLRVEHVESLHAHNTVGIAVKGLSGGYSL